LGRGSFLSNSFFLQINRYGSDFDLVLNKVYSGLGQMFSRFSSLLSNSSDASLVQSLREMLRSLQPEGALFAEIRGGVNTNLNLHPALCEYEIAFPGESREVTGQSRITLDDLSIEHNQAQDRLILFSHRLHCEIIPVYHGFLVPGALPTVQQVLLNFSPIYLGNNSLASLCGLTSRDTPLVLPRIALGNLILERKAWCFRPNDLPAPGKEQSDFDYLSAVYRWRLQHGIPDRVFVRVQSAESTSDRSEQTEDNDLKFSRKPAYLDFSSLFSVQEFQHAITKMSASQVLVVTEMLPCPKDASNCNTPNQFVGELVLDLNQLGDIIQ
jgi:hypothetical protein